MTILADTVPEVVRLGQQVRRAKIASERADADAAQAASEAAAARARYEALDAQHRERQQARNTLFAAALQAPKPEDYPNHAAYTEAFDAYQAATMQPLRYKLATA